MPQSPSVTLYRSTIYAIVGWTAALVAALTVAIMSWGDDGARIWIVVSDLFIGAAAVASVKAYMSKCAQDTLDEIALLLEARETDRAEKTGSAPLLPPQREPHEPRAAVSHLADHRSSS